MHRKLLYNADVRDTDELLISPGQPGYLTGWGVFSTLLVKNGVLFELERHYRRMRSDAARLRVPFPFSSSEMERLLMTLVEGNRAYNATLRVSVIRNHGGAFEGERVTPEVDLVAFTSDLRDWGSGVKLGYMPDARHSASPYAGAKITSWAQNLAWYELAHERGFDEFVLLNEEGNVSECTSANIFIIEEDQVLTPPVDTSGCLPGVTRAVLLEEIRVPGLTIREHDISPSDLEQARQVFITSSTRNLLPVLQIEDFALGQDQDCLYLLQTAFDEYVEGYVRSKKAQPAETPVSV